MWSELEIRFSTKEKLFRRYVWLTQSSYHLGKSLESDVLILHSKASKLIGKVQKKGTRYFFESKSQTFQIRIQRLSLWELGIYFFFWLGVAFWGVQGQFQVSSSHIDHHENQIISLPARGAYGKLTHKQKSLQKIEFQFKHEKGKVFLHYQPGNIQARDQLSLYLNGVLVGFAPVCSKRWHVEERVPLPSEHIKKGKNKLTFQLNKSQEPNALWGIREVYVTASIKESSFVEDESFYLDVAQKLFLERNSKPGQLARAKRLLNRSLVQFKAKKTNIPRKAHELEKKIAAEEEKLFLKLLSQGKQMENLGEVQKARKVYQQLLSEFTDPSDPRNQKIKMILQNMR